MDGRGEEEPRMDWRGIPSVPLGIDTSRAGDQKRAEREKGNLVDVF